MNDTDMLDLILKTLYQKPDKRGHLIQLLQSEGIQVSLDDAYTLGRRLKEAGYVLSEPTQIDVALALTTHGLDFVEHNSFGEPGIPISPQDTRISSQYALLNDEAGPITITIDPTHMDMARHTLTQVKAAIDEDSTLEEDARLGVIDCAEAVEIGIISGKPFNRYNVQALVELASDIPLIAGPVHQLVMLLQPSESLL